MCALEKSRLTLFDVTFGSKEMYVRRANMCPEEVCEETDHAQCLRQHVMLEKKDLLCLCKQSTKNYSMDCVGFTHVPSKAAPSGRAKASHK